MDTKKEATVIKGVVLMASAEYSEATAKRLIEDAVFLYQKSVNSTDELEKKRYSRLAVMIIPFYIECLANYLFDELFKVNLVISDNRDDLPNSIRKLRVIYMINMNEELPDKEYAGIRDIFLLRNKIMAHPTGRSKLLTTDTRWERSDISITYNKLKTLPKIYSHFYPEHVQLIFTEVCDFLVKYITSIKMKLTEAQYKYVWPEELISLFRGK